ncbi:hypothetical protein [Bradyrhizobium cenepequi]|uniref:hypothetical protein n=1 Tax=Bradyrhizobium cenepequi TaxID=2821403 RepID=UPI001CE2617D|nr:hypothetical protein [Bradyrhizobium cenepequi]
MPSLRLIRTNPPSSGPYRGDVLAELELSVPNITTVDAERTFWDKVVIFTACANSSRGAAEGSGFPGTITTSTGCWTPILVASPSGISLLPLIACDTPAWFSTARI